jgi:hypothetical protein
MNNTLTRHNNNIPKRRNGHEKELKKELLEVFRRFGYLNDDKDYEVTFRTTSGNIAWINIKGIEIIK